MQGRIQDFLGGGSLLGCACAQILDHAHFWKTMPTNGKRVGLHGDKLLENSTFRFFIPRACARGNVIGRIVVVVVVIVVVVVSTKIAISQDVGI